MASKCYIPLLGKFDSFTLLYICPEPWLAEKRFKSLMDCEYGIAMRFESSQTIGTGLLPCDKNSK